MDVVVERIGIRSPVGASLIMQDGHAAFQSDPRKVGLCGAFLRACEVNLLALGIESLNGQDIPIA